MKANEFIKPIKEDASGGGTSSGGIAVTPGSAEGKKVGSLFGGSYVQPKTKKRKTK